MSDQLPVPVSRGKTAIAKKRTTPQVVVPALIADLGEDASWRYTEFFSANMSNPNTRRAYARACLRFLAWCDDRGLTLTQIWPHDAATYIAEDLAGASAPDVKQQLAAVRMMFDWLVVGQMMPSNPG
jgi:site-specific recombinase XerD